MRIGDRGQVTIPQALREKYGFMANTEVEFIPDQNGLLLVARPASRVKQVEALYAGKQFNKSTDELLALLRE